MRRKRFIFFLPIVLIALLISVPLVMAKEPPNTFWGLVGSTGTNDTVNFLGTTDGTDLVIRTNNTEKMRIESANNRVGIGTASPSDQLEITGTFRLPATTGTTGSHVGVIKSGGSVYIHNFGTDNFFAGVDAGNLTMTADSNTGVGFNALKSLDSGCCNTATGYCALLSNISGT